MFTTLRMSNWRFDVHRSDDGPHLMRNPSIFFFLFQDRFGTRHLTGHAIEAGGDAIQRFMTGAFGQVTGPVCQGVASSETVAGNVSSNVPGSVGK
ncbi:MAG: hypothetical protein HGA47_08825 [Zoogloea sp.]|nr:hypothetical protein [Zoogloea sp.]